MKSSQQNISEKEFIGLIAMLMALVALAINMILPGFEAMTSYFALSTPNEIGLSVSLLYVGLAIGQVLFGAMSDGLGRKTAINFGLLVFVSGSLLSYVSTSYVVLIVGQIIQGVGLGAPRVVTMAIVRDRYKGVQMARIMSFIMVVFVLVPMISPFLGQLVIEQAGWKSLFLVFVITSISMGIWLNFRLQETLTLANRSVFKLGTFVANFMKVTGSPSAMFHAASLGVISGAFIAYLNMSQQLLQFQYELGTQYPFYFALMSCGIAAASFINGRAVIAMGMERLSISAFLVMIVFSVYLAITVLISSDEPTLPILLIYLITMLFCFGILVSNLNTMAMHSLGGVAGMGSAIVGAVSTAISIPLAIIIGNLYTNSVQPLIWAFGALSLVGLSLLSIAMHIKPKNA